MVIIEDDAGFVAAYLYWQQNNSTMPYSVFMKWIREEYGFTYKEYKYPRKIVINVIDKDSYLIFKLRFG